MPYQEIKELYKGIFNNDKDINIINIEGRKIVEIIIKFYFNIEEINIKFNAITEDRINRNKNSKIKLHVYANSLKGKIDFLCENYYLDNDLQNAYIFLINQGNHSAHRTVKNKKLIDSTLNNVNEIVKSFFIQNKMPIDFIDKQKPKNNIYKFILAFFTVLLIIFLYQINKEKINTSHDENKMENNYIIENQKNDTLKNEIVEKNSLQKNNSSKSNVNNSINNCIELKKNINQLEKKIVISNSDDISAVFIKEALDKLIKLNKLCVTENCSSFDEFEKLYETLLKFSVKLNESLTELYDLNIQDLNRESELKRKLYNTYQLLYYICETNNYSEKRKATIKKYLEINSQ